MDITINYSPKNTSEKIKIFQGAKISDILIKLDLKPDTVIALRNNLPIPIDEELQDADNITIIRVASGG